MTRVLALLTLTVATLVGVAGPADAAKSSLCSTYSSVGDVLYSVRVQPSTGLNTGAGAYVCVHVRGQNIGFGEQVHAYYTVNSYLPAGWMVSTSNAGQVCYGTIAGCSGVGSRQVAYVPDGCAGKDLLYVYSDGTEYRICLV